MDVSANYPEKEISLPDIAEVRYLHLNSDQEEYLYRDSIQAMSPNRVVVADARLGDIFLFSQEGMPVSRFNHLGNGPGEYRRIHRIFYDEAADDVFVVETAPPCLFFCRRA